MNIIKYILNEETINLQEYELKILSEFHKICEENNLRYILDYGTLLGAVRHKGFIPWDDDVDVGMPRKDYEKFKEIAPSVLPRNMVFQNKETDINYYLPFSKVRIINNNYIEEAHEHFDIFHGPWIDIFVYDYKHDNRIAELEKQSQFNKLNRFYSIITPVIYDDDLPNQNVIKTTIKKTVKFFIKKSQTIKSRGLLMRYLDYKYKKLNTLINKAPNINSSGEMMTYSFFISSKQKENFMTLNYNDFENRRIQKFEGKEFYIPCDYDQILKSKYGNYNELPPYNERKSHHIWLE